MTSRIVATGGSTAKRALMQPALPLAVTQPAGRGTCDCTPACPSLLKRVTAARNLTQEILKETTKTASDSIDQSGKLYAPQIAMLALSAHF